VYIYYLFENISENFNLGMPAVPLELQRILTYSSLSSKVQFNITELFCLFLAKVVVDENGKLLTIVIDDYKSERIHEVRSILAQNLGDRDLERADYICRAIFDFLQKEIESKIKFLARIQTLYKEYSNRNKNIAAERKKESIHGRIESLFMLILNTEEFLSEKKLAYYLDTLNFIIIDHHRLTNRNMHGKRNTAPMLDKFRDIILLVLKQKYSSPKRVGVNHRAMRP
jgi:hypothetical protein